MSLATLNTFSPLMISTALLSTLSWLGFIVAGFVLWNNGNTNGGYSMVGIAIILPAVVAVIANFGFGPLATLSALQISSAHWLGSLSWLGFIVCGFVLWAYGNTNGGYSMVGIATSLPFAVAVILATLNAYRPLVVSMAQLVQSVPLLLTQSWLGFIVSGFMLWFYGNTNGGYSMVGIAICLPAVVAALLAVHTSCRRAPFSAPLVYVLGWLSSLSWSGFLVAGFMLWYYGNTSGGYAMVGIAIILPAVVATALLASSRGVKALPAAVSVSTATAGHAQDISGAIVSAATSAPSETATATATSVVVDASVKV